MTPIFLQSWHRPEFTIRAIEAIHERTAREDFRLTVFDNGSGSPLESELIRMYKAGLIDTLHLEGRNTGCLYPKPVFHAMVPDDCNFYVVTDNDFIPCVGWLPAMLEVMRNNPDIALLTLMYLPVWPMQPMDDRGDYVRTVAVGNTFKLCRRKAVEMVIRDMQQKLGAYGDDGMLCSLLYKTGWEVGYIKNKFCYNLELTSDKWGYTDDQLRQDPRKAGYAEPKRYTPTNWDTLEPSPEDIVRMG